MKITFYYEYGFKKEIGTGHKYRVKQVGKELEKRGHSVEYTTENVVVNSWDVLVIDHMDEKSSMIARAKRNNMKVVLIDGVEDDIPNTDISISMFANPSAKYTGLDYAVFPDAPEWANHNVDIHRNTIFVGMGGYDANNYAYLVAEALGLFKINVIVTKSINHVKNISDVNKRAIFFDEENYYDAMYECDIAITNGGLTLFQSLHYGLPTIAIPQYEHQKLHIAGAKDLCIQAEPDIIDIQQKVNTLLNDEYKRRDVSIRSMNTVDGNGAKRIADLIESAV